MGRDPGDGGRSRAAFFMIEALALSAEHMLRFAAESFALPASTSLSP